MKWWKFFHHLFYLRQNNDNWLWHIATLVGPTEWYRFGYLPTPGNDNEQNSQTPTW